MSEEKRYAWRGAPFQALLCISFMSRCLALDLHYVPVFIRVVSWFGMIIFGYCLFTLYIRKHAINGLVTTGIFHYTRHPMYTGAFLMDLPHFFPPVNAFWIISAILFYSGLFIAGYFQEKETLSRFGEEAEEYYSKTPRFFFMYPFVVSRK